MNLKKLLPTFTPLNSTSKFDYKFTVFTPVYNRADTIHRVFNSLEKQTYTNFELLIINDGSTDNSHEVIQELISKSKLHIQYINNTSNRHKMACIVQGVALAKGEFFLPLDSDDACEENALEIFLKRYESIPDNMKNKISGVTCLCVDQNGKLIEKPFKKSPFFSSTFENRLNNVTLSEKWGFTKTDILKGININPDIFSKGYIPEGIIWNLISKNHFKTMYTNDVLRIYYLDTGNRISNQNHAKDAFGMAIFSICLLNWFSKDYFWKNPKIFLIRIFTLLRAAYFLNFKKSVYLDALENKGIRILFSLCWPFKKLTTYR